MTSRPLDRGPRSRAEGFALILALLALMLLTFLGLTLAVTTSTELQIASNYRWSVQAYANAEAGLEAGKVLLRGLQWDQILPAPRAAWPATNGAGVPAPPPAAPAPVHAATRNFENANCDTRGRVGYGTVLWDGVTLYENVSQIPAFPAAAGGQSTTLPGTITLWVRRQVVPDTTGEQLQDSGSNESLILTAEGSAPFTGVATALSAANRAVRVLETRVGREARTCRVNPGQTGGGAGGAGMAGCTGLTDDSLSKALGAAGSAATGAILDGTAE